MIKIKTDEKGSHMIKSTPTGLYSVVLSYNGSETLPDIHAKRKWHNDAAIT
jgi:hypothetical protein